MKLQFTTLGERKKKTLIYSDKRGQLSSMVLVFYEAFVVSLLDNVPFFEVLYDFR